MINDFSTLIQLSATLAIAFVAIEAVSSYTKTLCESVYCLQDYINTKLDNFFKTVTDRMTLDQIKPVNIEGKSTNPKIEEAKRNRENIEKEVKTLKDNI